VPALKSKFKLSLNIDPHDAVTEAQFNGDTHPLFLNHYKEKKHTKENKR